MLGDSIDSLSRSQVEQKARRQREREFEARQALEREALQLRREQEANQTAYQNQNLDLQKQGIAAQAQRYKNQDEREARLDKAYGQRTELELAKAESEGLKSQRKEAAAKFDNFMKWMQDGVKGGLIPADRANSQIKSALGSMSPEQKAALGDSPWLQTDGDFFQEPKPRPSERVVDPASGTIIYKENGQMVHGGVDPYTKEKADREAQRRLAEEAKAIPTGTVPAVSPMQTPAPAPAPLANPVLPSGDPKTAEIDAYIKRRTALGSAPNVGQPTPGPQTGDMHGVVRPQNAAEFNRLPKGVKFLNPADGKIYIKK